MMASHRMRAADEGIAIRFDPMRRPCVNCGRIFQPRQRNSRNCSTRCSHRLAARLYARRHAEVRRVKRARPQVVRVCQQCGAPFTTFLGRLHLACSPRCAQAYRYRQAHPVVMLHCRVCGIRLSARRMDRLVCSDRCANRRGYARRWPRERLARIARHGPPMPRPCAACGQPFAPAYGDRRRVYCSPLCYQTGGKFRAKHGGLSWRAFCRGGRIAPDVANQFAAWAALRQARLVLHHITHGGAA